MFPVDPASEVTKPHNFFRFTVSVTASTSFCDVASSVSNIYFLFRIFAKMALFDKWQITHYIRKKFPKTWKSFEYLWRSMRKVIILYLLGHLP